MKKSITFQIALIFIFIFQICVMTEKLNADFLNDTVAGSPAWSVWPSTLAVILVEFPDVTHLGFDDSGTWKTFIKNYSWQDFHNMLASDDVTYTGSPDGEPAFGSLRDYFWNMSGGTYRPNIVILNDQTASDPELPPQWYMMPHSKAYYANLGEPSSFSHLTNAAIALAFADGKNVTTSQSRRICVIYAGNRRNGIGAWAYQGGSRYMAFERWKSSYNEEHRDAPFTHIGIHAHEFSHLRNLAHPIESNRWSVLNDGLKNGPGGSSFGACPAALNPFYRAGDNWIQTNAVITLDPQASLIYNGSPNYFLRTISAPPAPDKSFLVENRQFSTNYDRYLPGANGGSGGPGGLLIWKDDGRSYSDDGAVDLIEADGTADNNLTSLVTDIFRPDGAYPYYTISDYSTPANLKLSSTEYSHFAIDSFIVNENTIPLKFITNYWQGTISSNTSWNDSTYVGADISISFGAALMLENSAIVKLFANIKTNGGSIVRQNGSIISPDIKLVNGSILKGQYTSLPEAFADATSSDRIIVNSSHNSTGTLNFTCDVEIDAQGNLIFDNADATLNGHVLRSIGGTLTKGSNVQFDPDIRLEHNSTLKGQYPSSIDAFADAAGGDEVEIYSEDSWDGSVSVPVDVKIARYGYLFVDKGTTVNFTGNTKLRVYGELLADSALSQFAG